jgi:hypothetical protein
MSIPNLLSIHPFVKNLIPALRRNNPLHRPRQVPLVRNLLRKQIRAQMREMQKTRLGRGFECHGEDMASEWVFCMQSTLSLFEIIDFRNVIVISAMRDSSLIPRTGNPCAGPVNISDSFDRSIKSGRDRGTE